MENERKWRKIRFARNLAAMIEGSGLDRKTFAAKAKVPYPWLQRATTGGITRLDRRGRKHLDTIARWFGLPKPDRLWDRDFVPPSPWNSREARATRIAEDLRRLILEQGEEAEPLKTILRLIQEAKGEGEAKGPPVGPTDRMPSGRAPEHPPRPASPHPEHRIETLDLSAAVPKSGAEIPTRPRGMRELDHGRSGADAGRRDGSAASPSAALLGKPMGESSRRLAAIHRRNTMRRWEELRSVRSVGQAEPGAPGVGGCVECGRPSEGRCCRCGGPLCDDCLALGRACEECTPAWGDGPHAEGRETFCGYCGREDVATACDECGEAMCQECAERGANSGDDLYCEGCAVLVPLIRSLDMGFQDSGEDELEEA